MCLWGRPTLGCSREFPLWFSSPVSFSPPRHNELLLAVCNFPQVLSPVRDLQREKASLTPAGGYWKTSLRRTRALKTQAPRPRAGSSSGPCHWPRKQVPSPPSTPLPVFLSFCRTQILLHLSLPSPIRIRMGGLDCKEEAEEVRGGGTGEGVSPQYPMGLVPQETSENIQKSTQAVTAPEPGDLTISRTTLLNGVTVSVGLSASLPAHCLAPPSSLQG